MKKIIIIIVILIILIKTDVVAYSIDYSKYVTSVKLQEGGSCGTNALCSLIEIEYNRTQKQEVYFETTKDILRIFIKPPSRLWLDGNDLFKKVSKVTPNYYMYQALDYILRYGVQNTRIRGYSKWTDNVSVHQLKAQIPFEVGIPISRDFYSKDGLYDVLDKPRNEITDWHSIVVIGYDETDNSFIFLNSWGKEWGNKGFYKISYDILNGCWKHKIFF